MTQRLLFSITTPIFKCDIRTSNFTRNQIETGNEGGDDGTIHDEADACWVRRSVRNILYRTKKESYVE